MAKENIDYKHNYDAIFKWMASVFTGKTLDVLGIKTGKITEVRGLEPITLQVKEERIDILLKDENGNFFHIEEERNFSRNDIYRFAAQHFLIAEQIKSDKLTTIITASGIVTPKTEIETDCAHFKPQIVNLNDRDGEAKLEEIRRQDQLDPVEIVFLPMYGAKSKTKEQFAKEVILFAKDLYDKNKLSLEFFGALVILSNKIVPLNILRDIWEEITVLQIFKDAETIGKEIGEKIGKEIGKKEGRIEGRMEEKKEIAANLLKDNMTVEQVVKATGLSKDEVEKLKIELS